MKEQLKQIIYKKKYSRIKYVAPILVIVLFLAGILGTLISNTTELHRTLQQNARNFANDETTHMANHIASRMKMRHNYIQNLADTFSRIPQSLITPELLSRKAEYLDMTDIFIINSDGTTIPANKNIDFLNAYLNEHKELQTESKIFVINNDDKVFFSSPIIYTDGKRSLVIGARSKALLQQMLQNVAFEDHVLCNIANSQGQILVPANDKVPLQDLNKIFTGKITNEDTEEAKTMLTNISLWHSGVAQFNQIASEPIMLGYDFVGINDWLVLTIVPSNLFSDNTATYFIKYIGIICFLSLVLLLFFLAVPWYYQRTLSHIKSIAFTDPLTGGYNDLAFRTECEELLANYPKRKYVVIYLNIRNFKLFNEHFGVKSGDELLRQISSILSSNMYMEERLGRHAGDHFYLMLEFMEEKQIVKRLQDMLADIERKLANQFSFDYISFEQGACIITDRSTDFRIITDHAKIASSYNDNNNDCRFYDAALEQQLEREHALAAHFQQAIADHEFQLYIQPKVCPNSNAVKGGEVLVRWQHPKYGLLFPGDFIPLFERNGKICELDFYMFEETCKLMQKWLKKDKQIVLSVNLSRAHLLISDLSFIDKFREIKESYHITDNQIELELNESMMLSRQDIYLVKDMINRIREAGFLCSIDDFGFGYSSLTILKDLNVNTVKLDRQFFTDESEKSWMIVDHLIKLIHKLEMTVVGEGIESNMQVNKLQLAGCNLIQGYFYAKPMPICDFENWSVKQ